MPAHRPEDLHELFLAAANAHDLDGLMALYEDGCVGHTVDGQPIQGAEAMRAFLGGFLERLRHIEGETRKVITTGDLALISNTWRGTIATPDGQTLSAEGTTGEIARRQPDGTWRLVIDDPAFTR